MATVRKRTWKNSEGEQTAWIADYFDQNKERHIKTFKTRKEAKAWLDETKQEVKEGIHTPANQSITVAEAGEQWIAQAETDGLERSTIFQYRQHLDHHIKPFIGDTKLGELSPAAPQNFRNQLIKGGRSRVMAKKVVISLGAILANAMAVGKVARNVVREQARQHRHRQRRLEKRHERELEEGVDFPTKDEIRALLAHAHGRWRPLVITAIFTGLRASELRGLTWDDVDLERKIVTVRQRADRWNTIGSPKSDSGKRKVPLAPMVINTLKEWRLACPKASLGLVFPNGDGHVEYLPNIHKRGLGPLEFAAGITTIETIRAQEPELTEKQAIAKAKAHPKYGLHALRHAAASLFIEQGWSPKKVQTVMGHSSIQVTYDTYGHLFKSADNDEKAMADLQARLVG